MKKYLLIGFLAGAVTGWFVSSTHRPKLIVVPTGVARLEVPRGCQSRSWMNGVELDCKNNATIYYITKLQHKSP